MSELLDEMTMVISRSPGAPRIVHAERSKEVDQAYEIKIPGRFLHGPELKGRLAHIAETLREVADKLPELHQSFAIEVAGRREVISRAVEAATAALAVLHPDDYELAVQRMYDAQLYRDLPF